MSLKPQLRDPSKDEEDVKAIARLFADMGDSYVELIATGSDESMMIVHALLEVSSHPEFDIASMTFNFWHNLQMILTERDFFISSSDEASTEAERSRRLQVFRPFYESLVALVTFKVQYPSDYAELSKEDQKDFKQTRYAVADVLIDGALVLGGEATLKILYVKLVEALSYSGKDNGTDWRPAEAALYCIRAISDYVAVVEAEILPQIMSLFPKLPHQPQLLQTVCLTIGAYSRWLDASSSGVSFLPSLIDILVNGMSISEDSAAAASLAFRHICNDCSKKLCGSFEGLFQIYKMAVIGESSFKVSAEDSLHLVEALSKVITELPSEQAKKALEALCLPAVTPLQEIINQGPLILGQKTARDLTVHIDRLANIFRHVNHPEAVADAIHRLWSLFKLIFDLRAWDMRTMESLCRACKNAVRTSKRFMGITVEAILEEIQRLYKQHHQPCFLYLSSEVIKIFGSDPACADYLKSLIESLFSQTTCLLTRIQEFTSRPDIADDCFLLASRCIRYCPQLFFASPIFPPLVDCAMAGMTVQHREASNSILNFLSDIFDLGNSSHGEMYLSTRDSVIIPRGPTITRILVACLTGALPNSQVETVTYALLALTRAYGMKTLEWAQESLALIPSSAVTDLERSKFLQALSNASLRKDTNDIKLPIEELSEVCRRNRTVQEIVQGALKPLELQIVSGS
ncbi:OLC1v1012903C2 [Oldenlandia corymbosa var. corymbosa]|nr:OLC1v1012903C2 [Oldenlandia corymbosa var. corymbosa]